MKLNFFAEGSLQETAFLPISDAKTQTAYEVEALVNTYLTYDSIELIFDDTIQVMHKWDSVSKTFLPSNSRSMLNGDNYQLELITEDHRTLTFQITEQDYLDAL